MSRNDLGGSRRTPDLTAFVLGFLFVSVAGLVLWSCYGGRLGATVLSLVIPTLLVLLGAGCLLLRGRR